MARWVFTVPKPGDDDTRFREWCAEHSDLFVVVSERRPRPPRVMLHRTTCARLTPDDTDGPHLRTCDTRETLDYVFSASEIVECPECLSPSARHPHQ
jgi:hypothetical protein